MPVRITARVAGVANIIPAFVQSVPVDVIWPPYVETRPTVGYSSFLIPLLSHHNADLINRDNTLRRTLAHTEHGPVAVAYTRAVACARICRRHDKSGDM